MSKNGKRFNPWQIKNALKLREMRKIKAKLSGYIMAFNSICHFDEKKLNWSEESEQEYLKIKKAWKAFCRTNEYIDEHIITAFQYDCMVLKTDLITQVKYSLKIDDEQIVLALLKKGMKPLEVADYSIKNLKTSKV
jgi:hypothetical protein